MYNDMITGERINYILVQHNPNDDSKNPLFYAEYNGGFNPTDMLSATRFDSLKKAKDLATLQNQMSVLLGSSFKYLLVRETVSRLPIDIETGEPISEEDVPVEDVPEEEFPEEQPEL